MSKRGLNYIMHIPKTGGTTLKKIIDKSSSLKKKELFKAYDWHSVKGGFHDTPELKTVIGHFRYGYHRYSEKNANYFVFLRNPVDQVLSHYYQYKVQPLNFPNISENINSPVEFATCPPYGYSMQTRFISGVTDMEGCEEEILNVAKNNLAYKFKAIGLTERFDESLVIWSNLLGWRLPFYQRYNVSKARQKASSVTEEEKQTIREINKYDEELYRYACQLFEAQKKRFPFLQARVQWFRFCNYWFWKLNPLYSKLKKKMGLAHKPLFRK